MSAAARPARHALVYGALAGATAIALICLTLLVDAAGHSMWLGYLVMLAALSLLFVGVKRYRDVECGGVIRFSSAFALGVAITVVAAIAYAAGWELYVALTGYDFMADYSRSTLDDMRANDAAPAAIAAQAAELSALSEQMRNPLLRIPMIMAEILPVGLVVALVSAALLRNPGFLPAHGPRGAN